LRLFQTEISDCVGRAFSSDFSWKGVILIKEKRAMDVRSITNVRPITEHGATCLSWFLFNRNELQAETEGGYLEFINEFQVEGGSALEPHTHNNEEFYYILYGRGIMEIEKEKKQVYPGDLIRIPPNAVHSIRSNSDNYPIHSLCFNIALPRKSKPRIE